MVSSNCHTINSLDITRSKSGDPNKTPYKCQITVRYPENAFDTGECPENTIQLTSTTCETPYQQSHSATICIVDTLQASGRLTKEVSMLNKVPGCKGSYRIYFSNNGNTTVNDFRISDIFPTDINVTKVSFSPANNIPSYNLSVNGNPSTTRPRTAPPLTQASLNSIEIINLTMSPNSFFNIQIEYIFCLLYTSPSPRDATLSRMPSSA